MTLRLVSGIIAAAVGVGCARSAPCDRARLQGPTQVPSPAQASPKPIGWQPSEARQALPSPPRDTACMLRDDVVPARDGVHWKLRTRVDAAPTMELFQGAVTAWLPQTAASKRAPTFVQIENDTAWVRGWVGPSEMLVVLKHPERAANAFVVDTRTDERVAYVEGEHAGILVQFPGVFETNVDIPCAELGLRRRASDLGALLPPELGETLLRPGTHIETAAGRFDVGAFAYSGGSRGSDGFTAIRHSPTGPGAPALVSIPVCGGRVFGRVARSDQLAPRRAVIGSSTHCPATGDVGFLPPPEVEPNRRCSFALPLQLASATFTDRVGELRPNVAFRIEKAGETMTRIVFADAPVRLVDGASWAIESSRLGACEKMQP